MRIGLWLRKDQYSQLFRLRRCFFVWPFISSKNIVNKILLSPIREHKDPKACLVLLIITMSFAVVLLIRRLMFSEFLLPHREIMPLLLNFVIAMTAVIAREILVLLPPFFPRLVTLL